MKKMSRDDESLTECILKNVPKKSTIGMDFSLFSEDMAMSLKKRLFEYNFVDDINNLIDDIWGTLKPKYNCNKILILPVEFTGETVFNKYKIIDLVLQSIIES